MRSKTLQHILNKIEKDSWLVKIKRWFKVELHVIKCLGVVKYNKHKTQSGSLNGKALND